MKQFYCNGKKGICDKEGERKECIGCPFVDGTGGEYIDVDGFAKNPYWERICKLSERQRAKGMATYRQGLESNPDGILKRLEHLQEELVDSLYYLEWIKDGLNEIK